MSWLFKDEQAATAQYIDSQNVDTPTINGREPLVDNGGQQSGFDVSSLISAGSGIASLFKGGASGTGTQMSSHVNSSGSSAMGNGKAPGAGTAKAGSIAGVAGSLADMGKGFIGLDENQQKYGASDTGLTDTVSSAAMALGPVGMIVGGAMKVGSLGAKAMQSSIDVDEFGRTSNDGGTQFLQGASGFLDPLAAGQNYLAANEKIGKDNFADFETGAKTIGSFMGMGNLFADDARDDAGDYMSSAKKEEDRLRAEYKESQLDINESQSRYRQAMMNANSIYGGNGQMMVALYGGLISKTVFSMVLPEDDIEIKYVPYKIDKKKIVALKKGGSVIPVGVLHSPKNNIGDKGLPLVYRGFKVMEIETDELVLHDTPTVRIKRLRKEYSFTKDRKILLEIGNIISDEIKENTFSYTKEFECLNNNTCKIGE